MMLDWIAYRDEMNTAIKHISTANPEIVKAYAGLAHASAQSKHLGAKMRELIALAVAVTLRCDGCINAHTDAAIKAGASKEEVIDALSVAIMVNAGAAMVYSARTVDAYEVKMAPGS